MVNPKLIPAPEPGIYDVEFETYLSWDAISNSRLNLANKSLAHFHANPSLKESKPLQLGSLTHAGQLEPLSIAKRYAVMPAFHNDEANVVVGGKRAGDRSFSKNTVYCREKTAAFAKANPGKEIVEQEQYDKMEQTVESICRDRLAMSWFNDPGKVEQSLVWDDPATGLRCKARVDKPAEDFERITDLKTTEDALRFPKSIVNFGYHRQMAHYTNGIRVLKGIDAIAGIVVVEKSAPFCTRSAPMAASVLDQGRDEVAYLLQLVANAKNTNQWPGYESPVEWEFPHWYGGSLADEKDDELSNWLLTAQGGQDA